MTHEGIDKGQGIGASVLRKEDERHMRGKGRFIPDFKMAGLSEVAFLRSPLAHARNRVDREAGRCAGRVFVREDLAGVKPIRSVMSAPGFRASDQHPLAHGKVRFVGEPVAMCVAASRALAEDLAESVTVELEELKAVVDAKSATTGPYVHDEWGAHTFLETFSDNGIEEIAKTAAVTVKREFHMSRQVVNSLEGKAILAYWDDLKNQLVVYTSTPGAAYDTYRHRRASRAGSGRRPRGCA